MAAARRPDGSDGSPGAGQAEAQREAEPEVRLHGVARELYGLPPEEFTAARTAAVKQARTAGDRALAGAVGSLRRPALAAWAVNLAVRERADLLEQVTSVGDALRQAQAQLDGEALRDLDRQRRRLVAAVAAEVEAVAAEHDHPLSAAASRQVAETVQAALVDPRAADAVRSGVLVQPLASTGVESLAEVLGVPLPDPSAAPLPGATTRGSGADPAADPAADRPVDPAADLAGEPAGRPALSLVTEDEQAARRAAEERAAAAEKAVRKAVKAREKAVAARAKAQARVLQLEAAVEELRGRLAEAEAQAEDAARRLADKESGAERAEVRLREAQEAAAAVAHPVAAPRR